METFGKGKEQHLVVSMHQNFLLRKIILATQILVLPSQQRNIQETFMREPQFSQELKILQDVIHLKTL